MSLSKEQILEADDKKVVRVPVPEWGGDVFVRTLTSNEKSSWEASQVRFDGGKLVPILDQTQGKLCALSLCDELGERLFTDKEVALLASKSASALARVFEAAVAINAVGKTNDEGGA